MRVLPPLGVCLLFPFIVCPLSQKAIAQSTTPITLEQTNFTSTAEVRPTEMIRLQLDRIPEAAEGKLAIFIGRVDVTSQFDIVGNELVYQGNRFPLPLGENTLTLYLVKPGNQWEAIVQVPLKVAEPTIVSIPPQPSVEPSTPQEPANSDTETRSGVSAPPATEEQLTPPTTPTPTSEAAQPTTIGLPPVSTTASDLTFTWNPRLSISIASQFAEKRRADAGESLRPRFTDITYQAGLDAELKVGALTVQSQFNFLGVTNPEQALRFGQLGEVAPQFDLSEYQINATTGPVQLSLGHLCYGNHPFLLDSFCSRGVTLKANLGDRLDVSINSMSATAIVGFDDFTGLNDFGNNITSFTLGYQLVKNEVGGIRLEASYTDGQRKPIGDFNEGQVIDAEKSSGFGVRLFGSDNSGRFRLDAGFARSKFTNPRDRQLSDEIEVIPVEAVTKNAYYADVSYDLFREVSLGNANTNGNRRTFSFNINARHERLDPQFQTLGASVSGDQLRNRVGFNLQLAGANLQFSYDTSEDNLANIPTLLKTKTQSTTLNLNLPLQTVLDFQNPFLPTINYSFQRVHQFGANVPIPDESSFDPTEIPDQITIQHQAGVQWNFKNWNLSYQYSSALQDNRQPSRENADFFNVTNQITFGWQVSPRFLLNLGYNWTRAEIKETGITQFSQSPTLGFSWQVFPEITFAVNYARNINRDSLDQTFAQSDSLEAVLTWNFTLQTGNRAIPGSTFIRYSKQTNSSRNNIFSLSSDSSIEVINGGLSFSF